MQDTVAFLQCGEHAEQVYHQLWAIPAGFQRSNGLLGLNETFSRGMGSSMTKRFCKKANKLTAIHHRPRHRGGKTHHEIQTVNNPYPCIPEQTPNRYREWDSGTEFVDHVCLGVWKLWKQSVSP